MRRAIPAARTPDARCADCGRVGPGLYWEDYVTALDLGGAPVLTTDVASPVRCDDCEGRARARTVPNSAAR